MNGFGKNFYDILKKYRGRTFLKKEIFLDDFICYCDDFPGELLRENIKLAGEKARYVSRRNQRGITRSPEDVKVNVFKGIMAETVGQLYLTEVCGFREESVKRYDFERTSFGYDPKREYDVGIFKDNLLWAEAGVKASKIDRNGFESFLKNQHCIIGKYKYQGRAEDHNSSYYLGIIIVYDVDYNMNTFLDDYLEGKVRTYIVSGASFSEMTGRFSTSNIRMNQEGTTYNLGLRSYIAGDADNSKEKLRKIYNNEPVIDYIYSRDPDKKSAVYVTSANYYRFFHLTAKCPFISGRNDVIRCDSVSEAAERDGIILCPECRKIIYGR